MEACKITKFMTVMFVVSVLASVYVFNGCLKGSEDAAEQDNDEAQPVEEEVESGTGNDSEEFTEEPAGTEEEEEKGEEEDTSTGDGITEGRVYGAILKSVDLDNCAITIEQLINEPNEPEIENNLKLDEDCKVIRIVVIRDKEEKEYSRDISLKEVAIGSEIGIMFEKNMVSTIISSFLLDASAQEINASGGEYMVSALLKAVDTAGNAITVEQLINEPDKKIIEPGVKLASGYKVYKSILVRVDEGEKEYTAEISIGEIPLNTEIGIGFTKDNLAKIIISQEWFEN